MKSKSFIQNLSQCIFQEYKDDIPKEELKSSFVAAIKNISSGKLKDDLNQNFDRYLKKLEKNLKNLSSRELPSISTRVDDSLEELTKSELDGRTEVTEKDNTKKLEHIELYNVLERPPKKPSLKAMKKLDDKQRYVTYRTFLQKVLNRDYVTSTFIKTVIQDFEDLCDISKEQDEKSKFDWLPLCSLLLELTNGSRTLAIIRVLRILFESIQTDVDKCLAKGKVVRSGKLANILKKFITSTHLKVEKDNLKKSEEKMYCRYISALLSFFIDLCCVHSSKVEQKKMYGREIAGYVCYILQQWPESILEVGLQLQGMEDDYYNILFPLISKCLEVKPSGTDHVYYLKYVLLVRQVKDAYGEHEEIQAWNLATKSIPAKTGFLDWLKQKCPEAMEYVPVEDKKFKKTKITRFLLEEAEDDLVIALLNSVGKEDENTDDVPATEEYTEDTSVTMATDNLYYLDKAGGSSSILELADGEVTEEPNTKIPSHKKNRRGSAKAPSTKHKPIVLKTVEDVEKLVNTEVLEDGTNSPQTYTFDRKFVMEKVKDPEDQKFLQSEIISITSVSSVSERDGDEESEDTIKDNDSQVSKKSDKSAKWTKSNSSTPNKGPKSQRIGKKARKHETDDSDISAIEKTEDFGGSVTSASEDDHKIKSVVRKVTPRKVKSIKSPGKDEDMSMSDSTIKNLQNEKTEKGSPKKKSTLGTKGIDKGSRDETVKKSKDEIDFSENVINVGDSDNDVETKDDSNSQLSKDTDMANESSNEEDELSSVHESSVEIVNIILEPGENSNSNLEEEAVVSGEKMKKDRSFQNRQSISKVGSPKKSQKTQSPRKQLMNKSPIAITTGRSEEVMSETSLSCMSGLSTVTNYSETVEISSSEMDQNSTVEGSELENTAMYIEGEGKEASDKSESDLDTVKHKSRKGSKKSLSGEKKDIGDESIGKSPKKSHNKVSKKHSEVMSDEDVFQGTPEKKNKTQNTRSIEDKFIEKAIKGKKTPKKSNNVQEVSGSVSVFTDPEIIEGEGTADGQPGKRTKSTEEIFAIVKEIKEKIRTPSTRKSVSNGKGKLNESMFTDDSVESLENQSEISSTELKSLEKKRKLRSDSSDNSSPRKIKLNEKEKKKSLGDEASDVPNLVKSPVKYSPKGKTPSKVGITEICDKQSEGEIIDLSDDESGGQIISEEKIQENNVSNANTLGNTETFEETNISPRKSRKNKSEKSECFETVIKTPSPIKSPLKMKERKTPQKSASDDEALELRSPVKSVQSGSGTANSPSGSTKRISVRGTPDKRAVTPKQNAVDNTNNDNEDILESKNTSKQEADTIDIVSDSDSDNDNYIPDKIDSNASPKSGTKKSPETPRNKSLMKTPKSSTKKKMTPSKRESDAKNMSPAMKHAQEKNPTNSGENFVLSSREKSISNTPSPKKSPLKMKERKTSNKTGSDNDTVQLRSPVNAVQSGSEIADKPLPEISVNSPRGSTSSVRGTPDKKAISPNKNAVDNTNNDHEDIKESKNMSNEKVDTIDIESDSNTDQEMSDKIDLTPKEKIDKEKKSNNKTPQSAKRNIRERKEDLKTPEGKTDKDTTPKSGTKKSPGTPGSTSLVKTPKSGKKKKQTPGKSESAAKNMSPAMNLTQEKDYTDSGDDFVPSSQKKLKTVSDIKISKKKETHEPSSNIESDEDLTLIPDIGAHLKPESPKTDATESKSPCIPSSSDSKTSQKQKNENTPQKSHRQSQRMKDSPNQSNKPGKDSSSKKRVTRTRGMSEKIEDPETESDVDGPTRAKRLRSVTKTAPETAKTVTVKEKAVKSKADLKKVYDWKSETDDTTDQSDVETRRSRRSKVGSRLSTVKDKIPEPVEEEPIGLLSTPAGKLTRQRLGSASTTKKNVKNIDSIRGTRKRRLSGELGVGSSAGNNSTDSEVSFPTIKSVAGSEKKSKRLSTPMPTSKAPTTDASGRRYSLRKK